MDALTTERATATPALELPELRRKRIRAKEVGGLYTTPRRNRPVNPHHFSLSHYQPQRVASEGRGQSLEPLHIDSDNRLRCLEVENHGR